MRLPPTCSPLLLSATLPPAFARSHKQGGAERQLASKAVDRILAATADDIIDVGRAIGKFEAAAREERHRMKMKVGALEGWAGGLWRAGQGSSACVERRLLGDARPAWRQLYGVTR